MEGQIDKLVEELQKLREMGKLQYQANVQLEIKLTELKEEIQNNEKDRNGNEDISKLLTRMKELEEKLDTQEIILKKVEAERDQLLVKVENLTVENDELVTRNKKLEDQVADIEESEREIFNTLNMPLPVTLDITLLKRKSTRDVEEIKEIRAKTLAALQISPPASSGQSKSPQREDSLSKIALKDQKEEKSINEEPQTAGSIKAAGSNYKMGVEDKDIIFSMPRSSVKENFIESLGILKKQVPYLQPHVDDTLEQAKLLLVDQTDSLNAKKQSQKKVRLSTLRLSFNDQYQRDSHTEENESENEARNEDRQTFADFLIRNRSNRNSLSSNHNPRISRLPSLLLDNMNDKKFLLKHSKNTIDIEIISLELAPNSSLLSTEDHNFLYVEYSFLGYKGHLLETQSLPRPFNTNEPVYYRFRQRFEIKPDENERQLKLLESMIRKNSHESIKFFVVSEPIDSNEDDERECEEIGFAVMKLYDVVSKSLENSEILRLDVFSTNYPNDLIAYLSLSITGIIFLQELIK